MSVYVKWKLNGGKEMFFTEQHRKLIEDITQLIRELYEIKSPIKDMICVVDDLPIKGQVSENEKMNKWETKIKEGRFEIIIPKYLSNENKNMQIAKAFGSICLYSRLIISEPLIDNFKEDAINDMILDEFALSFLMPKNEYIKIVKENQKDGYVNVENVAKYFHVSNKVALRRGVTLGILSKF